MIDKSADDSIEVICPNCGNGWAACDDPADIEFYDDEMLYSLFIDKPNPTQEELTYHSRLLNVAVRP